MNSIPEYPGKICYIKPLFPQYIKVLAELINYYIYSLHRYVFGPSLCSYICVVSMYHMHLGENIWFHIRPLNGYVMGENRGFYHILCFRYHHLQFNSIQLVYSTFCMYTKQNYK